MQRRRRRRWAGNRRPVGEAGRNGLAEDVVADHLGGNVLIVGHSNTVPPLINAYLGTDTYPDMTETEHGNLYKVTVVDSVVTHEMTVHN